ncbi:aspartyl-phosphate phosphatase Spo0E family protein [Paramaledivibacter caminithermalis]|uniref:Spo0E like sporulation regulatory protein n=1 Tax=Paramaledivibacter caminithermalis (strain DSM 15212 / CIP 107654 / DViRD3) TaxID=1121301 RepID=A0A1M6MT73_PARC5|nr:aspartyl-phosphate phosphatase Spo0E family protein [Paramaledivibacter caminithermalis]SHJ86681.1 Spo0E like sporulation regulatory protein [Paramaledivibacter caminithermalis DSM 15212]
MTSINSNENLNTLEKRIKFLRAKMHKLIETKGDISAPEIIEISQILDKVLVQYLKQKSV